MGEYPQNREMGKSRIFGISGSFLSDYKTKSGIQTCHW